MKALDQRAKDLAFDLQHEAQTHRIYAIIREHFERLLQDEASDLAGMTCEDLDG